MKLTQRILLFGAILFGFLLLFSVLVGVYAHNLAEETQSLVDDSIPALMTLEHLRDTIYEDNILVQEYLLTDALEDTDYIQKLLAESSHSCIELTGETTVLIENGVISDPDVIIAHDSALLLYGSLENHRNDLLIAHRNNLAGQLFLDTAPIYDRYKIVSDRALFEISSSVTMLNQRNIEAHEYLAQRQFQLLLLFVFVFGFVVLGGVLWVLYIVRRVTKPIDHIVDTTKLFTSGNYGARVQLSSPLIEIGQLQDRINAVLDVTKQSFAQDTTQEAAFKRKFLTQQYKDVVDVLTDYASREQVCTMTDIRKALDLTHPTVLARIKYLEKHGFITITKEGRQKIVALV